MATKETEPHRVQVQFRVTVSVQATMEKAHAHALHMALMKAIAYMPEAIVCTVERIIEPQ